MSVIVLGTVALDTVKTPFGFREQMLGGSAAHFSMAARLFSKVNLVAVVGQDFPPRHIKFLGDKGIVLDSLIVCPGQTFKWRGEYQGDLNTAITLDTQLGVLASFRPQLSEEQKKIKYIFLANIDPEVQNYLLGKAYSPQLVALDSMNYWINNKRKALLRLLKKVDIYVANDQEARSLSGENNLSKCARTLSSFGPKMILIKKGEHGVLFYSKNFIFSLPAYLTERVIDPTGAGDTFAGGFMGYLSKVGRIDSASIKKAIVYGTIAASFNVEAFGLEKTSKLSLKGLEARVREFKKLVAL
jgi:sugar/nucleoside kinase (ribokinase family)